MLHVWGMEGGMGKWAEGREEGEQVQRALCAHQATS